MVEKDKDEQFEWWREFVEYNASFMNPDAVKKLRNSRDADNQFETTDDLSEKMKEGTLFDDPLIREIKPKNKSTNNSNNIDGSKERLKGPLYDIIKDI